MLSPVDQIKDRLSISDVVSSYLKLEKTGQNFKARCPFHNEKTPSFFISPARGSYHCFGCNRGGDIFSFVEEIEGVTFAEALKTLAEKAGVQLTPLAGKENLENKKSYALLDAATKFFETNLLRNAEVKDYLKKRGLKEETVRNFRLGKAPAGWSNLLEYLKSKGFSEKLMEENGLIIKGQKGFYDRFRGRIMFPLSNSQGRVVGFTGRIWGQEAKAATAEAPAAKYVNSPETALYNKSRILYGYDKAKRAMLTENFCVIVEGQMDLLMAHQVGTVNSVAVSGTALTEEHIRLIKRFTDIIVFAFDSDDAGIKAATRGVLAFGMDVKMIKIPNGLDPADLILKDPSSWKKTIKESKHIVDFLLDRIKEQNYDEQKSFQEVKKNIVPILADINNELNQAYYIKKVASWLYLPEESVRAVVVEIIKKRAKEKKPGALPDAELEVKSLKKQIEEKISGLYLWQTGKKDGLDLDKFKKDYARISGKNIDDETGRLSENAKNDLIFQVEMYYPDQKALNEESEELLNNFEKEFLEERLFRAMSALRRAEEKELALRSLGEVGNEKETEEILKECHQLSKRINEIKNSRFLEK